MTQIGLAPDALFMLADATLAAVVNYWPSTPVAPLPARQFVSNGTVFWDCSQLAVTVERVFGTAGDVTVEQYVADSSLAGIRGAIIAVHLLRPVPDIDTGAGDEAHLPDVTAVTGSALDLYSDAVVVWNCLQAAQRDGRLASCQSLAYQDWTPIGPDGGLVDAVTHVRIGLL